MPRNDVENRVSVLEAKDETRSKNMDEFRGYLIKRSEQTTQQHLEVMSRLAVISTNQEAFKEYQRDCDEDRREHNNRLGSLESSRTYGKGWMAACGLFGTITGGFIDFFLGKH